MANLLSTTITGNLTVDTNVLYVDSTNDRVGIGTTSPTSKLHIVSTDPVLYPLYSVSGNGYTFQQDQYGLQLSGVYASLYINGTGGTGGRAVLGNGGPQGYLDLKENGTTYTYLSGTSTGNSGYSYFLSMLGVGTSTALGAKFQVRGSGSTSATTSLLVQNSSAQTTLQMLDDGSCTIGRNGGTTLPLTIVGNTGVQAIIGNSSFQSPSNIYRYGGGALTFYANNNDGSAFYYSFNNSQQSATTTSSMIAIGGTWQNQNEFQFANLKFQPTYDFSANTQSTAIARGIYYNPTITNLRVAQHRAIETTSGDVIFNGGNVGIGTSSPAQKLHVIGDAWINRPSNKVDNNVATEFGPRVEFNNSFAASASGYMVFRYPTYNNFLIGGDYDGNIGGGIPNIQFGRSNGTVYVHIDANGGTGNVGIGTTNPATSLDVNGTISSGGSPIAWFSGNYNRIYRPNGTVGIYLGNSSDEGNYYDNTTHYFRSAAGGTNRMIINSSGNVLIGTTTDSGNKLEVNGSIRGTSIIKNGGTSWQYLKADGSVTTVNSSTDFVRYGDFVNYPTFAGKTVTMHPSVIKTLLWGGQNIRYTVTDSYTGTYPQAGSTWVRTFELIDGSNSVYSSGNIYCGFWNNYPPANITVRVQNTSGTWYGPYQGSNIGVGYFEYWRIPCGGPNFIKAWEITFTPQAGLGVNLLTTDIVIDNNEGIDQDPFVSRGGSSIYGTLSFKGTGSATTAYINNSGGMYLAGNLGIGTTSPAFKTTISADITKSGDVNSGTAQLSLEGATTPGKRMILGYDTNSNGFGFIKAGNYGVTWTALSLQPDGGNVGIGTTSPSKKLHVYTSANEGIFLQGTSIGVWMDMQANGSNIHSIGAQVGGMGIYNRTAGAYRMFITDGGNVLIGTTTDAGYKLDVNGDARLNGNTTSIGYLQTYGLFYHRSDFNVLNKAANGWLTWVTRNTSEAETTINLDYVRSINASGGGNVGIGTFSPSSLLNVVSATQNAAALVVQDNARKVKIGRDQIEVTDLSDVVSTMYLQPNANLVINSNSGNVGIGTQPSFKLDVNGTVRFTQEAYINGVWSTNYGPRNSGDPIKFVDWSATELVRINTTNGNLGIGTTSPTFKLEVTADASINGVRIGKGAGNIASNTIVGYEAGLANNGGTETVAIGYQALRSYTTASKNTVVGHQAAYAVTTGNENTAMGYASMNVTTTGVWNTAIGSLSLFYNSTGNANTAVGKSSLYNTTSSNNTAVGWQAGFANTSGILTAFGYSALRNSTTAYDNTAIGYSAMYENTTGGENTAVGKEALKYVSTGSANTGMGVLALFSNNGSRNTGFGYRAGANNLTGTDNVFLGHRAGENETGSNKLYISNSSTSNLIYGDFSTKYLGFGTTSPGAYLHVKYSSASIAGLLIENDGVGYNAGSLTLRSGTSGGMNMSVTSSGGLYWYSLSNSSNALSLTASNNLIINGAIDNGKKLQVNGDVFIKGSTSASSTKIFEVQNSNGTSIMDFRGDAYAFFGCGQGGGAASGFIFRYNDTSHVQFTGYNYGNGAGSYKPILLDTDLVGRGQGIYVNFGGTGYANPAPLSSTEFAVRGRTSDATENVMELRDSNNTEKFVVKNDGAIVTNGAMGWTGTVSFPSNPPGQQNLQFTNGILTNVF